MYYFWHAEHISGMITTRRNRTLKSRKISSINNVYDTAAKRKSYDILAEREGKINKTSF